MARYTSCSLTSRKDKTSEHGTSLQWKQINNAVSFASHTLERARILWSARVPSYALLSKSSILPCTTALAFHCGALFCTSEVMVWISPLKSPLQQTKTELLRFCNDVSTNHVSTFIARSHQPLILRYASVLCLLLQQLAIRATGHYTQQCNCMQHDMWTAMLLTCPLQQFKIPGLVWHTILYPQRCLHCIGLSWEHY